MFRHIRIRLTLIYTAILAAILLLSGVLLYVGMQHQLLGPFAGQLQHEAQQETQEWQMQGAPPRQCFGQDQQEPLPYLVACFSADGSLISANPPANFAAGFASASEARSALSNPARPMVDTVTTTTQFDAEAIQSQTEIIQRYTTVVHDATGQHALGVLEIGLNITPDVLALNTLLEIILAVGILTLCVCAIGGVLLGDRALAPARLAFERQQQFIADASHELRTPLTLLRADAEVLLRGRNHLDPEDTPLLDDIVAEAEHMGTLAENLLTLARLDHGSYHIEQEVIALDEIARDIAHRTQAIAAERQIHLDVECAGPVLVLGDPARLREIVLILVDNALKYNRPGGTVTLHTAREGAQAILEVRDTGVGIAAEHLAHLGERFYRVDKARSRQMGGAGLGLSIARSIAAMHHGNLAFTSTPGQGTTAILRLPAVMPTSPKPASM